MATAACDISMPIVDGGLDAHAAADVTTSDTATDAPRSDVAPGTDTNAPFDGAGGTGNGTCAETGSFCLAQAQCCSGFCNTTTMWSGGICDTRLPDSGTGFSTDGGASSLDGGNCENPCHCPSNQHCCLVSQPTATCGVALQCSVIEGCL